MTPALRFVGASWTFFRRQPALRSAAFVLVFLPLAAMNVLDVAMETDRPEQVAVTVVLYLGAAVLATWGSACVLTVGRRLLQAKAGRLRTSFKAVRGQAKGLIVPIILTEILRGCIAALLCLPAAALAVYALSTLDVAAIMREPFADQRPFFYVSGVCVLLLLPLVYQMLTSLAPLVVAYEKIAFRQALRRSIQLTRRHIGRTLVVTAVLGLFWIPGIAADLLLSRYANPTVALVATPVVSAAFDALAAVTWLLSLTQFYKALGGKTKATAEDE